MVKPIIAQVLQTSRESFEDGRGSMSLPTFWLTCPTTAEKGSFLSKRTDLLDSHELDDGPRPKVERLKSL
jgi:hypothetical protein